MKSKRKKWTKFGLNELESEIRDFACCLALASADRFDEGVEILEKKISDHDFYYQRRLHEFVTYVKDYWGKRKERLCVGHLPQRTNNLCESLNSRLTTRLGGRHPRIWKFVCRCIKIYYNSDIKRA